MPVQLCSDLSRRYRYDICNSGYGNAVLRTVSLFPLFIHDSRFCLIFFVSFHRRDVYIKLDKKMGNPQTTAIYIYINIQ